MTMAGGSVTTVREVKSPETQIIMYYFSMHNCPPCREFTPILVELYHDHNQSGKLVEVIFFSGDQDQDKFNEYFGEMPWIALPFKDSRMRAAA